MADTYSFCVQAAGAFDAPFLVITNTDYANPNNRMVVRGLDMKPPPEGTLVNVSAMQAPMKIQRCSAYTGGTEQTITSARSSSAAPSQVKLVTNPETATVGSLFGQRGVTGRSQAGTSQTAAGAMTRPLSGKCDTALDCRKKKASAFSYIQLAEGEGLICYFAEPAYTSAVDIQSDRALLTIEFTDGTDTFITTVEAKSLLGGNHVFVLFNGSGSGVTLSIISIQPVYRLPSYNSLQYLAGTPLDPLDDLYGDSTGNFANTITGLGAVVLLKSSLRGKQASGGETVELLSARSDAASLSGKIDVRGGTWLNAMQCDWDRTGVADSDNPILPSCRWPSVAAGAFYTFPGKLMSHSAIKGSGIITQRKRMTALNTVNTNTGAPLFAALRGAIGFPYAGIALAPGEQLIILPAGNCAYTDMFIEGTITYEAGAGAVYPAVGDVDSGVQYGPNATDYTGTLEQPAITDVLSGVSYGAGGTEFTGTATGGGGGGNTYSRGRITNA